MTHIRSLRCWPKKLKTEKSHQFKFSGNQKQFEFNADLDYDIGKIKRAAEAKDYAKTKDICSDARDKIHKRSKCIKLANTYPGGWDTVKENMSDDLASDTDDEKRIRQAEFRAIRKRNQRKQENSQRRQTTARPAPSATFPNPNSGTVANTESNFRSYNRISTGPRPVLGVTDRDIGDVTAPRSSPSRQKNDSDKINDKYFSNLFFFYIEQSVLFEYEISKQSTSLKGRLNKYISCWREIECN